jgi:hypothetical protein
MLKSIEVHVTDSPTSESHIRIVLENAVTLIGTLNKKNTSMQRNAMKRGFLEKLTVTQLSKQTSEFHET